jgi:hypothetical protein
MHPINQQELEESLNEAINGRRCTEAWLGYGEDLFLGFGGDKESDRTDCIPPYELQSVFADWWIEDKTGIMATADDERAKAEEAARLLIRQTAVSWRFASFPLSLEIEFDGGMKVVIMPMADALERTLHEEAWNLRMPDGYYRFARWDGTLFALHKDEPCSNRPSEEC